MRVLGIDTTTGSAGVALLEEGRTLGVREQPEGERHSRVLLVLIVELLDACGSGLGDVERIAAAVGPGSFTGIRIGLATAQGLGTALGRPVVGVDSLVALAWHGRGHGGGVVTVVDSRRDEVFAARFEPCPGDGGYALRRTSSDLALSPADAFRRLVRDGDLVLGEGAWRYRAELEALAPGARLGPRVTSAPAAVAILGGTPGAAGAWGEPQLAPRPIYVRRQDAELVARG